MGLFKKVVWADTFAVYTNDVFAKAGDLLLKPTKVYMEKNLLNIFQNKIILKASELKDLMTSDLDHVIASNEVSFKSCGDNSEKLSNVNSRLIESVNLNET